MECKCKGKVSGISGNVVLIETLWNVNEYLLRYSYPSNHVLIETLWNVNEIKLFVCIKLQKRINRNIVECKFVLIRIGTIYRFRINRNIVECKLKPSMVFNPTVFVLIETLWNVNSYRMLR